MDKDMVTACVECLLINLTLCSEEEYVDCEMYPKLVLDKNVLIVVSILMIVIFLTGVFGNTCVFIVIARNYEMRNPTNYYLFNLAISDMLLLLFGLPQELFYYWHTYPDVLGNFVCKLRVFTSEAATYASVLTVVAFSIERYIAICHPLQTCSSGLKRAVTVIICIWTLCFICAVPFTLEFSVIGRSNYPPGSDRMSPLSTVCGMPFPVQESMKNFMIIISVVFFLIPMLVLSVVYVRIGICIRSRNQLGVLPEIEGRIHSNPSYVRNNTAIKVLVAVVIAFFICWAPFHFQRIMNKDLGEAHNAVFVATGLLYYLSATINPVLYNVMSRRYREAFKETFLLIRRKSSGALSVPNWQNVFWLRSVPKECSTRSTFTNSKQLEAS